MNTNTAHVLGGTSYINIPCKKGQVSVVGLQFDALLHLLYLFILFIKEKIRKYRVKTMLTSLCSKKGGISKNRQEVLVLLLAKDQMLPVKQDVSPRVKKVICFWKINQFLSRLTCNI